MIFLNQCGADVSLPLKNIKSMEGVGSLIFWSCLINFNHYVSPAI